MASPKAIATLSAMLARALGHAIPAEALEVWEAVLKPIPDDLALNATMDVLRNTTGCFAVAPGAVYQAALERLSERYPSEGEAWELVRQVNRGERTREDLPMPVRIAAEQIGWFALREAAADDVATRAHFIQFYREARRQVVSQDALGKPKQEALKEGAHDGLRD